MTSPTQEQSKYLSTLEDVANMIRKAQINMKKCPKQRLTAGYVKARIKAIEEDWDVFKQTHSSLMKCTPREQRGILPYFLNEEYFTYEEMYLCLHADLSDLLTNLEAQQRSLESSNMSASSHEGQLPFAKLPRIQLPTFTGRYEEWPTYKDIFTALVHNTSISDVRKLHYLKTSVAGEAETLLRNIQITESNYAMAWELLERRFGNKKMIVSSVLKKFCCQKKITNPSATQIKALLDNSVECINSLNNMNINTATWDPIIVFLVAQKLDSDTLRCWEEEAYKENSDELSTWVALKRFLESKFRTLELIAPTTSTVAKEKTQGHKTYHVVAKDAENAKGDSAFTSSSSSPSCVYCKGNHYIYNCKEFAKQTVLQRRDFAKTKNLCFNCLVPNHTVFKCKQNKKCRVCGRKHHSLLHEAKETTQESDKEENNKQESNKQEQPTERVTSAHFSKDQSGRRVLLATAQVHVTSSDGETHVLRALIDQGSEASLISSRVVELLRLKKTTIKGVVSGVGEGNLVPLKHVVDLSVTSRYDRMNVIQVKAYVLKSLSAKLPSKQITMDWPALQNLLLADPTYNTPGKIDILLGADVFCKIIEDGLVRCSDGIVAQKTTLGWILSGQSEDKSISDEHKITTLHVTSMVLEDNDLLKSFWEIETALYKKRQLFTREEEMCEEIYKKTTKRINGKYTVHLPLRQGIEETLKLCGDTKQQAVYRFKQLEKKFQRSQSFKSDYSKVIQEYIEMGHLKRSNSNDDNKSVYLPHHAVIREDKDTTKVRVVYDASAKGSNGHSLNDTMMIGPVLQPDLRSLIITWRTHRICVVGDIIKMYRMIDMTPEHTNLQRIVWRNNPEDQLESYNLMTVTFGTAAAPYLAVRTLLQLAEDEALEFPNTAPVIKNSFFMDDLMTGNDTEEKVMKMCEEIKVILSRGNFKMQKWSSNSERVLKGLQEGNNANSTTKDGIEIKLDKVLKILGLTWDRKDDTFKFTINLPEARCPVTKRAILSDVARLFDPFGWLSPVIVDAKVFIQKLWLCNMGWDDELPSQLIDEWMTYRRELIHLQNIAIPRWFKTTPINYENIELHGFADASMKAYAAVTYLKVIEGNTVHITIIASRTKVAPLKQLSIPKLELCAAALLAELINDLKDLLKIPKNKIFAWTDSMVVMSWLQSQPSRWRTFVANRVADITRILDNDRWRFVQSTDNPADIATRGVKASDLASFDLWWSGPEWLKHKNVDTHTYEIPQTELELKASSFHTNVEDKPIWEYFSSISRMKRILAYCRRFRKQEGETREKYLTVNELDKVLELCIKYYQGLVYQKDIEDLQTDGNVKKRSSLISLAPFLDKNGIIRVGGRLENAEIADITKHPIVIPCNQHLTKLIVQEAHLRTLHGGIQAMMAYVRTRYWVIGLKSVVRKCIHNCKTCILDKAKVKFQFMGQLPAVRVNQYRPFMNSGVDYAGPVLMRTSKGRGHHATKGYICLFVCMATRAIHLEAVTDLTTQAFIAAFRRFVARRGHCSNLWSDNGTNFVGAAKELKEMFRKGKNNIAKEAAELLANDNTTWHFIPPRMPTCGGLWEAGVQSAKRHLFRINKDMKLTYEEISTLLAQIEACLNSRPLYQMDNTIMPLTPGHFLVGEPLISVPDTNYECQPVSLLTRWQVIQKMTQDFWHRWRSEYLNTLQQRYKWQVKVPEPAIGDVVIIKEDNLPPTKWLLGRVKQIHPGKDNLVRVVTVQTAGNNELKRPLYKLIPLPKEPKS